MQKLKLWLAMAAACSVLVAGIACAVGTPLIKYNLNIFDEGGEYISSGLICQVYTAGSTTAPTLYSDINGTSSTSATITVGASGVSFYGPASTYDIVLYDTPLTTKVTYSSVTPVTHKLLFPKLATRATVNTFPQINLGALKTLTDSDTCPVVTGSFYKTGTTATTINNFQCPKNSEDGLTAGQLLIIQSNGDITFDVTDSGLIGGTTDIITADGDITTWIYDGTNWFLQSFTAMDTNLN